MTDTSLIYQRHKWVTFLSMYAAYMLTSLNRKSFSFTLPAVMQDGKLDKNDLGLIASGQNFGYAISKFCSGLVSDSVNARTFLSSGLILSGLVTVVFTGFESASVFAVLWFVQGIFQGAIWPSCAKILRQWSSPESFGTLWSVLSSSMNVAAFVGPVIATLVATNTSWRVALVFFGTGAIVVGLGCVVTISNSPAEVGLEGEDKRGEEKARRGRGRGTWQDLVQSPLMAVLFVGNMIVFMTRTAALDWGQLLLIQERGQSVLMGSAFISSMELGGMLGSVVAGLTADKLVAMSRREDTRGTPRMTVVMGFVLLTIISVHTLVFVISEDTSQVFVSIIAFTLGFGLYGPVSLYGVMAVEAAPTHLSGTSHAICALAANVGAVLAGLPLSYVAKYFDWTGAFFVLEILLIVILIIKIVTRNLDYKMISIKKKLQ